MLKRFCHLLFGTEPRYEEAEVRYAGRGGAWEIGQSRVKDLTFETSVQSSDVVQSRIFCSEVSGRCLPGVKTSTKTGVI